MTDLGEHYAGGNPYQQVRAALDRLAPGGGPVTLEQLGGFDDFHSGGRIATERMADLLSPAAGETVLDAGSGLGGPARYLADRFACHVVGIDLTPAFVDIAGLLNERTGFADRVEFRVGDVTALDLGGASVDHVWTQHVAMNIADRRGLYAELRRVLRRGGRFALFDVVDGGGGGELLLPVPWATTPDQSHLVTPDELRELLQEAGFVIQRFDDPTAEMVQILRRMLAPPAADAEPPVLGGQLYIKELATKAARYFQNMDEGRTALVLALCTAG